MPFERGGVPQSSGFWMRAIFEDLILSIPREKYDVSATAVSVPRLIDVRLHFKPFVFIQAKLMEKD